jgi:hypothetical protein
MTSAAQDLELAKLKLMEENFSLVIVKKGKVLFKTQKHGIRGFLEAIKKLDKNLVAASAADKVVGVAAAMLCSYTGVASIFAQTISEKGIGVLQENNIIYQYERRVPNILNRDKTDVCPFEKLAMSAGNPEEVYVKLKSCTNPDAGETQHMPFG